MHVPAGSSRTLVRIIEFPAWRPPRLDEALVISTPDGAALAHVTRPGETFEGIARLAAVEPQLLRALHDQAATPPALVRLPMGFHVVHAGESWASVAADHGLGERQLLDLNRIGDPLCEGTVLRVPAITTRPVVARTLDSAMRLFSDYAAALGAIDGRTIEVRGIGLSFEIGPSDALERFELSNDLSGGRWRTANGFELVALGSNALIGIRRMLISRMLERIAAASGEPSVRPRAPWRYLSRHGRRPATACSRRSPNRRDPDLRRLLHRAVAGDLRAVLTAARDGELDHAVSRNRESGRVTRTARGA